MFVWTPGGNIPGTALGDERMDMRVPFEVSTERVKDANKPRSKVFSLGQFTRNYTQTTKRGLLTTNKG